MDASTMLFRNKHEPFKVLYHSVLGQSFIINSYLDEVIPFHTILPYQGNNSVWEAIQLEELTGDERNFLLCYAEEDIKELEKQ
jgi:hypothetical protein